MTTKQKDTQHADHAKLARQQLNAMIGKNVLHVLGQPRDLHSVQVRHLWEDHYRVNVLVGSDAASVKVAHSYFLVTGKDGTIIASTPKIPAQHSATAE